MLTTDKAALSQDQTRVVSDARMGMLRFRDGRFERIMLGEWVECEAAAPLAKAGLLELLPDPFDDMARRVGPTQAGLNAIGLLTPAQIMTLELGAQYDGMVVSGRSWSKERSEAARAVAGPDAKAWQAALGVPCELLLTGDGRGYDQGGWCRCAGNEAVHDDWVRFQRWSARGLEGHGFLHGDVACRRLLQSG